MVVRQVGRLQEREILVDCGGHGPGDIVVLKFHARDAAPNTGARRLAVYRSAQLEAVQCSCLRW